MENTRKLWIGIGILILLTPLGLLAEGTAWGEWGVSELPGIKYIPQGMAKLSNIWRPILPDYNITGWKRSFALSSIGYIFSGIIGITAIYIIFSGSKNFFVSEEE